MLNYFSEQDIASLTEWLTKHWLQKLRDTFEQLFGPRGGEFDR